MNAFTTYVRESLTELHKVQWPTQQQAVRLTLIVTVFIAATSLFFGAADVVFTELLRFTLP